MTQTLIPARELLLAQNLAEQLAATGEVTDKFWQALERFVSEIQNSSAAVAWQTQIKSALAEYQEHLDRLCVTLKALPRELRKRPFVKEAEQKMQSLQSTMTEMKVAWREELSLSWAQKVRQAELKLVEFKQQITQLKEHALIQRFIRGELVLGSTQTVQWGRKILHVGMGMLAVWFVLGSGLTYGQTQAFFTFFIVCCVTLETSRHLSPHINQVVFKRFRWVMREREKVSINSGIYYMLSMYLVSWVFDRNIVLITFMCVAWGDPLASLVGVRWGKRKILRGVASLEGTLACFLACFLCCLTLIWLDPTFGGSYLLFALIGGATGAIGEVAFPKLDDNLVMPLVTSSGLALAYLLLG